MKTKICLPFITNTLKNQIWVRILRIPFLRCPLFAPPISCTFYFTILVNFSLFCLLRTIMPYATQPSVWETHYLRYKLINKRVHLLNSGDQAFLLKLNILQVRSPRSETSNHLLEDENQSTCELWSTSSDQATTPFWCCLLLRYGRQEQMIRWKICLTTSTRSCLCKQ